jgi:pilus assembly protein Flp/PilA
MLRYFVRASEALSRLRRERHGVASFEYVAVAACVVAAVGAAFGTDAGAGIAAALGNMLNAISASVLAVVV